MTGHAAEEKLFDALSRFGKLQLHGINARDIPQVTAHLMVATAFFTGAAIQLASRQHLPKSVYLPALQRYLTHTFGLPERNAAGLVESNARLYKRYVLIENIYNQGWQAGKEWQEKNGKAASALTPLLRRYRDLSMSTLGVEGIKKKTAATREVEDIAAAAPVPQAAPQRASRLWLWWLLLLAVTAAGAYYYFIA
jgi:hypothetical protein